MLLVGNGTIQKTHYDILSVKEDASYEEIRAGYKSAVLNCHPDKLQRATGTSDPHEMQLRFLKVQKAWEILSNSRSRAAYDHELEASRQDTETDVDVSLEDMIVEDIGEAVMKLLYHCRCGDYFTIDSAELEEMGYSLQKEGSKISLQDPDATPSSVILPCGSCSLKICLIIDSVD